MISRSAVQRLASSMLMFSVMVGSVLAQTSMGTLRGTVADPSGALVPQADITISNTDGFRAK